MATQQVSTRQIKDGAITNAKVSASAAIDYSKLNLAGSVVNADIASGAAIADSKLATITTAGKVANSATTATANNTASTIVLRDASGNFSAGDVTAANVVLNNAPTLNSHATTKLYVDQAVAASAQGLVGKDTVRAVATTNVASLSGTTTVDGVALVAGDIVLLTAQTTGSNNGPWVVAAGAWTRPSNFDTSAEAKPNSFWFVNEGTAYADTGWWLTTNAPITLGTTSLTITQFVGAGTFTAGTGLTLSGGQFSITNTGVSAGTYGLATVTVNAQGQITSAAARSFSKGGGTATAGQTTFNTVASPVANSSQLTINGSVQSETAGHYTINATSGVITLQDAMEAGDVFEWQVLA